MNWSGKSGSGKPCSGQETYSYSVPGVGVDDIDWHEGRIRGKREMG